MLDRGFIVLHRSIADWRWYKDANTFRVFVHLLLAANYEAHDFENITVQRGQLVTSYQSIADALNLSVRNVRTAITHLKTTGELTSKQYPKFSLITILNYDLYQAIDKQADSQPTSNRQADDSQVTTIKPGITKKNKEEQSNNNISMKAAMHCYGEYKHIRLTDEQYEKLVSDYGEDKISHMIQRCDEYCQANGKTYRDYNLTLRNWLRKDEEQHGEHKGQSENCDDRRKAFRQCAEHY